ncbi:PL29 family lyase N-terminal domain-containing protein [Phocaeicola plebeius]|uniref:PL29 family lyase N-terminal domain-containing protein n=1 Tax=Phocaeicola plebeius TaxID=310297 RepID=UPI0026EB8FB9|nr:PL29 family lyase N-terminal domain-containing protein [Phocaeicola plebeius]
MKKHILLFLSIFSLVAFSGCDDRDEIRDDINALSARLDALQVEFDKLNSNINTFYNLANGKTYFTSYTQSENGDYTLKLSGGTSWTVYGGMPEGELPVLTINEEGKWIFSYNGEEIELEDGKGNPATAFPVNGEDGSTPKMSIDENGYWCYQIGDGAVQQVPGPYNVAEVDKINPSIFEEVKVSLTNSNVLQFKLYGSDDYMDIALLGGLDMTFSNFSNDEHKVTATTPLTLTARLKEVATVVISPTPLEVKFTEETSETSEVKITVPSEVTEGTYTIYFEIYNEAGYRLVKPLTVTVE